MSTVTLTGLASNLNNESRALADIEVSHNSLIYNWQIFIPENTENIDTFLQSIKQSILDDIDNKEALWSALDPKTRTIDDPFTGLPMVVDIAKEEIVKPCIPDYCAKRRAEYPPIGDQLDAMWMDAQNYTDMLAKITAIKLKYPKP